LSTKGGEKSFSLPFVIFLFGSGGKMADFRSGRLLSGGRAVSLLGANACGVSPVPLDPPGVKHPPLQSADLFLKL